MKKTMRRFILSTVLSTLPFFATAGVAKSVTTITTQPGKLPTGSHRVDLNTFDLNKDGMVSAYETGEMLAKLFDTNNDDLIDSTEYDLKSLLTVLPMQKQTTITYDFDNDGMADKTKYTTETFMQKTQLARLSNNPDGLSAHDFFEKDFSDVDTDDSGSIDHAEWQTAYIAKIEPIPVK